MSQAACTVLPISSPAKQFRLLPAGRFRSTDGRPKDAPGWFLDSQIAAALIHAASTRGTDYVIDYEHQTLNTTNNGQPAPAAGWFHTLEWRNGDGLYVTDARWTEAASKMLTSHEYRYISPVFQYDGKTGAVERIIGAALTNNPALDNLTDLAAAAHLRRPLNADQTATGRQAAQHSMLPDEVDAVNAKLKEFFGASAVLVR